MQGYSHGFLFDSVPNDFVAGELEHAIVSCATELDPDLIVLEGQSSLRNPSGPAGSEFLLSAGARGVSLPPETVQVVGRVVYTNVPGNLQRASLPTGMAVRFTEMPPGAERAIRHCVAERALSLVI